MTRSDFLKTLLKSFAIGRLPVSITKDFRKIYLLQSFVAGFQYYEGVPLLSGMKEGDLLELVREPGNKYDSCAIALHWQGKKIGFIPAAINEMLSYLLDAEALSLFAVITHLEKNAQPWENVAIAVYFVQEVNKELPAHASYLTRIEAPHYRTLKHKERRNDEESLPTMEDLFKTKSRLINLDTIPDSQPEAKKSFETLYPSKVVQVDKPGRFVLIDDEELLGFMHEIEDDINEIKDQLGNVYLEFKLV